MTITLVNPPTWGVGDKLTSAQANQIDANLMTVQADYIAADDVVADNANDNMNAAVAALEAADVAVTAAFVAADEVIQDQIDDLINNGTTEGFPLLKAGNTACSQIEWQPFPFNVMVFPLGGGAWTEGHTSDATMGSTVGQASTYDAYWPLKRIRNNARLTKIRVYLTVNPAHVALPAVLPSVEIVRTSLGTGAAFNLGAAASAAPADVAEWNAPGVGGSAYWEYTPSAAGGELMSDDNAYWIKVRDESGANALGGNRYWGALLYWTLTEVQP